MLRVWPKAGGGLVFCSVELSEVEVSEVDVSDVEVELEVLDDSVPVDESCGALAQSLKMSGR